MDSFPHNRFQQQHSQTQQSKPFRKLYNTNMEGRIPQEITYYNNPNLLHLHPPYIPVQVEGLVPSPVREETGLDLEWSFDLGPSKKRPKEQAFLDNNSNSQISCVDFFSTGLGLSLDIPRPGSFSGHSGLMGLFGGNLDLELQRQEDEIDRYIKNQGNLLRQSISQKFKAYHLQTISCIEQRISQKIREKDSELEELKNKNTELESQIEQISLEANSWPQQAKHNENVIDTLKLNLQQAYAQSGYSKEGFGDSEIKDTASCCKIGDELKCRVCEVNEVCMLLLPCKHLCLCKDCESKLSLCPLCHSAKYVGMEVYM